MSHVEASAPGALSPELPPAPTPAPERPLGPGVMLAYGAPSFAGAAMAIPIGIHLTIFYSDTVLIPLGLIALVKALARAFDARTDPLMGWLTDRTRTRWGRRRPWLAEGTAWYLDHFSGRELRRAVARGAGALVASAARSAAVAALLAGVGVWLTIRSAGGLDTEPGLVAVLAMLLAGVATAAACYHLVRLAAARRYPSRAPAPEVVEAHVALAERLARG